MHIHKFDIRLGVQDFRLPKDAVILTVQAQFEQARMWVLLDGKKPPVTRRVACVTTGINIDEPVGTYVATFQMLGGHSIFHVFDLGEVDE